jgi:hypothetical protein
LLAIKEKKNAPHDYQLLDPRPRRGVNAVDTKPGRGVNAVDTKPGRGVNAVDTHIKKEEDKTPFGGEGALPPNLNTPDFRAAWQLWRTHLSEKRKPMTPTQKGEQLARLSRMGPGRAVVAIRYSVAQGWPSIIEPPAERGQPQAPSDANHKRHRQSTEHLRELRNRSPIDPQAASEALNCKPKGVSA